MVFGFRSQLCTLGLLGENVFWNRRNRRLIIIIDRLGLCHSIAAGVAEHHRHLGLGEHRSWRHITSKAYSSVPEHFFCGRWTPSLFETGRTCLSGILATETRPRVHLRHCTSCSKYWDTIPHGELRNQCNLPPMQKMTITRRRDHKAGSKGTLHLLIIRSKRALQRFLR